MHNLLMQWILPRSISAGFIMSVEAKPSITTLCIKIIEKNPFGIIGDNGVMVNMINHVVNKMLTCVRKTVIGGFGNFQGRSSKKSELLKGWLFYNTTCTKSRCKKMHLCK